MKDMGKDLGVGLVAAVGRYIPGGEKISDGDKCRVCGGDLKTRDDDQDGDAINKRHGIYYDTETGTLASAYYFKDLSAKEEGIKYITLNGKPGVKEVAAELVSKL